jgi:hypothetical protein
MHRHGWHQHGGGGWGEGGHGPHREEHGCGCGCECGCGCHERCGCEGRKGESARHHAREGGGLYFERRFATQAERTAELEEYLQALRAEAQAVEEQIAERKAGGG